eukprot:41386_1
MFLISSEWLNHIKINDSKHYSNIFDIYLENIKDSQFTILVLFGCIAFYIVQKIGENIHFYLIKEQHKQKIPMQLFGTHFQSSVHALLASICSYFILFKYLNRTNEMEVMDKTDENYIYVIFYKISTVFSVSYFIVLIPYELFIINQPLIFRIAMLIHHFFGIFCQSLVFLTNPLSVFISAMMVQCELSNIFLNLHAFGLSMDNKYMYFVGGVGALITYPLTRIVFLIYSIYILYNLKHKMMIYISAEGFYLVIIGEIFVILLSSVYSCMLFKNVTKTILLKSTNNDYIKNTKQS